MYCAFPMSHPIILVKTHWSSSICCKQKGSCFVWGGNYVNFAKHVVNVANSRGVSPQINKRRFFSPHKINLSLWNNMPSNLPFNTKAIEGKEISKLTPKQSKNLRQSFFFTSSKGIYEKVANRMDVPSPFFNARKTCHTSSTFLWMNTASPFFSFNYHRK